MSRILVVEDERKLADAIAAGLQGSGYDVTLASTGESGLRRLEDQSFELVLLDLMLPRMSGLQLLREMRQDGFRIPVLILSSRSSIEDKVSVLDIGADDYLVKPFAFPELLARLRALERRARPERSSLLQLDDLSMDLHGRTVVRAGVPIDLTAREFEVLEYLLSKRDTVVSRDMLARDVWKVPFRYSSLDNVIDVHIARIRRKIDEPFSVKLLHTVRGVGFVLRLQEQA